MSLEKTISRIVDRPRYDVRNEANTIDRIIFPILANLGWDVHHELDGQFKVEREYLVESKKKESKLKADVKLASILKEGQA